MMQDVFSTDEINRLSEEMDARLAVLAREENTAGMKWIRKDYQPMPMPEKEAEDVEKAVADAGQTPESFWKRFKKAAHEDLCMEGGVLYAQWKKWGDLSNEKVLKQFAAILVAMGFSGNALQVLALACGVVVVHIGVKAYCMEAETAADADNNEKDGAK